MINSAKRQLNNSALCILHSALLYFADVAELADALVSGSSEAIHVGSSPVIRTKQEQLEFISGCFCFLVGT